MRKREDFKQLVHGAEAAGKDDQGLRKIGEPKLAHEEVVELEVQRRGDVGIRILLEGQMNIQADGLAAGLVGP